MTLDDEDIDAIAQAVARLLRDRPSTPPRLVDAATLADDLSVERDWVYAHATELRAIRLGGPRGRLRFDRHEALRALKPPTQPGPIAPTAGSPRRRRHQKVPGVELIAYES